MLKILPIILSRKIHYIIIFLFLYAPYNSHNNAHLVTVAN